VKVGGSWSRRPYLVGRGVLLLLLLLSDVVSIVVPFVAVVIISSSSFVTEVSSGYNDDRRAHPVRPPTETNIQRPDGSVPWDGRTMERVRRPVVSDCGFGGGGALVFPPFVLLSLLFLLLAARCSSG